jgi:hypothetical protein
MSSVVQLPGGIGHDDLGIPLQQAAARAHVASFNVRIRTATC